MIPPKQALADALHQFKLDSNDACFSRVQEAVRHAIPLLPDDFFAQCHEVIQVAGPLAACYLRAVSGGHVFQTDEEFDRRIRTSLFFPADPSQQPPANLSLVDRKRLMVLAYRANAALNLKRP